MWSSDLVMIAQIFCVMCNAVYLRYAKDTFLDENAPRHRRAELWDLETSNTTKQYEMVQSSTKTLQGSGGRAFRTVT